MPDEQKGLVKENYMWSVLLHRGATSEGIFLHVPAGSYDRDLFTMTWGPTIAALSYVFDKSLEDTIIQKAIAGFRYIIQNWKFLIVESQCITVTTVIKKSDCYNYTITQ